MKDLVAFELHADFEDFSGGNVSLVDGELYDVGEALEEGEGRIVLGPGARETEAGEVSGAEQERAFRDAQILDALDKYPALERVEIRDDDEPQSFAGVDMQAVAPSRDELLGRAGELNIAGRHSMSQETLEQEIAQHETGVAEGSSVDNDSGQSIDDGEGSAHDGEGSTEGSDD